MHGTIESPNPQAVATWMISAGIAPISIEVHGDQLKGQPQWVRALQGGGKVRLIDLLMFTQQIGTMVKAGVPMLQALAGIQKSTANKTLVDVIRDIRADLDKGVELSNALARHPKVFDDYYVSMVRVGETSGQLEEIFKSLFRQLEFDKYMQQKIKGAFRYPSFVLTAISIAIAILTIFVVPVFAKLFSTMKIDLPVFTRILIGISNFAVGYWWAVLAVLGTAFYGFKLFTSLREGRYAWDKFKLRLPIAGSITKKATLARFCRSFATASKSGVPLVQTFTLVSRVVDNAFYEERILLMRDGVERGESMLRVAQTAGIFTPLELQMIAVGEETGDIESMLQQVADMYQEEVEYEVSRLSESIEPIMLVVMGLLVLTILLGIFLPLWDLTKLAHKPG